MSGTETAQYVPESTEKPDFINQSIEKLSGGDNTFKNLLEKAWDAISNTGFGKMLANIFGDTEKGTKALKEEIMAQDQKLPYPKLPYDYLEVKPGIRGLLNMIGGIEAGGNYNAVVGNAKQSVMDFSQMSIREVLAYQKTMIASGHESTAVGKYQVLQTTLSETVAKNGIDLNSKFNPAMQDKIATHLMERRGLHDFMRTRDIAKFQMNLSKEWAAIPKDDSNISYHDKTGSNKALISSQVFKQQLEQVS